MKITQHSKMGFKPFTVHLKKILTSQSPNATASRKPPAIRKFLTSDEKDIFDKNDVIKSFFEIYENLCPLGYTLDLKPYHNLQKTLTSASAYILTVVTEDLSLERRLVTMHYIQPIQKFGKCSLISVGHKTQLFGDSRDNSYTKFLSTG